MSVVGSSKPASSACIINCIHRGISRLKAEQLLLAAKQDGSFLIRDSETIAGAYTLCLLYEKHVHQYRILPDADGKLAVQSEASVRSRKFADLTQLIQEYMMRGAKNGLAGPLRNPVSAENPSDDESDEEKMEEFLQYEVNAPPDVNDIRGPPHGSGDKREFDDFVHRYFLQRFKHLNFSSCDSVFIDSLKKYVEVSSSVDAATAAASGGQHASAANERNVALLRGVFDESAKEIDQCIDSLMIKIDICRQLFGPMTTTPLAKTDKETHEGGASVSDMSAIIERMTRCKGAIQNLKRKAELKYRDLTAMWKDGLVVNPETTPTPSRGFPCKPIIPATSFEAKVLKLTVLSKIKLTVDIQAGKLLAVKPTKDVLNDKNVFTHDRIEQLIKSTENKCRLDVTISGVKRSYVFEDMKNRENFCQLVQQLKNMHSVDPEVKQISIYVGSWNMASEIPMYNLLPWLLSDGVGKKRNKTLAAIPHDIYVIGTQESALSDKEWTNKIKSMLVENFGIEFHQVTNVNLWGIRLLVLVKTEHKNKISLVQQSCVRTGLANALGNKGAVGVSFSFNRTSLCFVCSHLASGTERLKKRNQNFRDIIKGLSLGPKNIGRPFDVTTSFHHMFFFGDLNYRLDDLSATDIVHKIKNSTNYGPLLECDQLKRIQRSKEAFVGFREEEISFPPTYRIAKGSRDRYVWEKLKTTGVRINVPSWCDRVLWRSYPDIRIVNTSYGSVESVCSSDHKPLFSSFDIRVATQFTSSSNSGQVPCDEIKIIIEEISAEVKSSKQESFQIGFYSTCLEVSVESKQNISFGTKKEGYCCPKWTSSVLPQLQPIFDDWDYMEDQHLLLTVKTSDGLESYGECVIALKTMLAAKPQTYVTVLTHLGEETGSLRIIMHVKAKENSKLLTTGYKKTPRDDELIYMDTDFLNTMVDERVSAADAAAIYQDIVVAHTRTMPPAGTAGQKPTPNIVTMPNKQGWRSPGESSGGAAVVSRGSFRGAPSHGGGAPPTHRGGGTISSGSFKVPPSIVGGHVARPDPSDKSLCAAGAGDKTDSGKCVDGAAMASGTTHSTYDNFRYTDWPVSRGSVAMINDDGTDFSTYEEVSAFPGDSLPPNASFPPDALPVVPHRKRPSHKPEAKPRTSLTPAGDAAAGVDSLKIKKMPQPPLANIRPAPRSNLSPAVEDVELLSRNNGQSLKTDPPYAGVAPPSLDRREEQEQASRRAGTTPAAHTTSDIYERPPSGLRPVVAVTEDAAVGGKHPPATVEQWLAEMGLTQYLSKFLDNGWDHYDFLTDMNDRDLQQLNIASAEHHNIILLRIVQMKERKRKNM